MIHNIPQPAFEELVARELAQKPLNEIRKNHSFVRLEQVPVPTRILHEETLTCRQFSDYVLTTVEDRNSGREYIVKSTHVVACDGARSAVRRFLGVESEGEDSCKPQYPTEYCCGYADESVETMMTIHFNADLRPVIGDRVGMLHWIMDPETSGFIIGYDLSGNLVLICNFDVSTL